MTWVLLWVLWTELRQREQTTNKSCVEFQVRRRLYPPARAPGDERAARANQVAANGAIEASRPQRFRGDQAGPAPGRKAARAGCAFSRWVLELEVLGHPRRPQPKNFWSGRDLAWAEKCPAARWHTISEIQPKQCLPRANSVEPPGAFRVAAGKRRGRLTTNTHRRTR